MSLIGRNHELNEALKQAAERLSRIELDCAEARGEIERVVRGDEVLRVEGDVDVLSRAALTPWPPKEAA